MTDRSSYNLSPPPGYDFSSAAANDTQVNQDNRPTAEHQQLRHVLPNLPSPSPVVLSWDLQFTPPFEVYDPYAPTGLRTGRSGSSGTSGTPGVNSDYEPEPFGNPPGYIASRRPTEPVVYTFSQLTANSMLLIPPATAPDTRPQYHISVGSNCFIPTSFITTIHRGASEHGEFVGDFEMGMCELPATVCIRGKEYKISEIMGRKGPRQNGYWDWLFVRKRLRWDCTAMPRKCTSKEGDILYANFTPRNSMRMPNQSIAQTQLEIMPEGQDFFDDILLSVMVIERTRLTPFSSDYRTLFNG